ncbi:MAG TPA: hypothetical protein PKE45_15145 [Caldilineaceae bacterium]|nr:hypothetical protein [Caldilineaceae bacterium]
MKDKFDKKFVISAVLNLLLIAALGTIIYVQSWGLLNHKQYQMAQDSYTEYVNGWSLK